MREAQGPGGEQGRACYECGATQSNRWAAHPEHPWAELCWACHKTSRPTRPREAERDKACSQPAPKPSSAKRHAGRCSHGNVGEGEGEGGEQHGRSCCRCKSGRSTSDRWLRDRDGNGDVREGRFVCYSCYYAGKPRSRGGQGKQSSGAGGGSVGAAGSTGRQGSKGAAPDRTSGGGATGGSSSSGGSLYDASDSESEPSDGRDTESWDGGSSARGKRRRTHQVQAKGTGAAKRRKGNGTTGGDGAGAGQGSVLPPRASAGGRGTGVVGPGPQETQRQRELEQWLEQQRRNGGQQQQEQVQHQLSGQQQQQLFIYQHLRQLLQQQVHQLLLHQRLVTTHANGNPGQAFLPVSPQQVHPHDLSRCAGGAQHTAGAQGLPTSSSVAQQAAWQGHAPAAAVRASADGTALTSNLLQAAASGASNSAAAAVSAAAAAVAAGGAASPVAAVASPFETGAQLSNAPAAPGPSAHPPAEGFLLAAATEASPARAAGASEAAQATQGAPALPDVAAGTCRVHHGAQAPVAVDAAALEVERERVEEQRQIGQEQQAQAREQGQEREPDCVGVPVRLVSNSDMQSALHAAPHSASTDSGETPPPPLAALRLLSSPKRQLTHQQQPEPGVGGSVGGAAGAPSTALTLCLNGGPARVLGTSAATVGVPVEVPGGAAAGPAYSSGVGHGDAARARVEAGAGAEPSGCFSTEGQALGGAGEGPGPQAQGWTPIEPAAGHAAAPMVAQGGLGEGCPGRTVGPLQLLLLTAGGVPHVEEVRKELYGTASAALYGTAACGRHGKAVRNFVDALLTACEVSKHMDVQL